MDNLDAKILDAQSTDIVAMISGYTTLNKEGVDELSGPCPRCGGTDRLKVSRSKNRWFCRTETGAQWLDAINFYWFIKTGDAHPKGKDFLEAVAGVIGEQLPDAPPMPKTEQKRIARHLDLDVIVEEYHARMAEKQRAWWEAAGIPAGWQDYWGLGYAPEFYFREDEEAYVREAYTIPFKGFDGKLCNMQYRVVDPPSKRKYRWVGVGHSDFWVATPDTPLTDQVFVLEGAKKAAVFQAHLSPKSSVLAVPSKSDSGGITAALKDVGRVYVILDPDGAAEARKMAVAIGKNARVIELPVKIDDGILNGWIGHSQIISGIRYARKPENW